MESLAENLRTMVRTPLADDHVRAIRRIADVVTYEPGETGAEDIRKARRYVTCMLFFVQVCPLE